MSAIIIGELCPYCQKHRSPQDFIRQQAGIKFCTTCEERHQNAITMLSTGKLPGNSECSECGTKAAELLARGETQLSIHFEAGLYRFICMACDKTYTPKRRELYAGTEFGQKL